MNYFFIPLTVIVIAFLGNFFTVPNLSPWYENLNFPSFTPSGSFIGSVWTIIFILVALSAILVWNSKKADKLFTAFLFLLNGFLNVLWSFIFFKLHLLGAAFFEALLLELSVLSLIFFSWRFSKTASLLLAPYAFWVAFASFLTFQIWSLN
jgi:tryptophan-rich sensory protein